MCGCVSFKVRREGFRAARDLANNNIGADANKSLPLKEKKLRPPPIRYFSSEITIRDVNARDVYSLLSKRLIITRLAVKLDFLIFKDELALVKFSRRSLKRRICFPVIDKLSNFNNTSSKTPLNAINLALFECCVYL